VNYYFTFKVVKNYFNLPDSEKPLALHDIDVSFPKGSLNMIIGEVGSGKTAFFDLLLNEL